ncbi:MAG: right-handed parallel beta-helix repeat-containing protein [Natronohydrobacter sp.]|nr:right-handed parallel beta-helix repeat-containing protein [Natronohydrobacter sp.]
MNMAVTQGLAIMPPPFSAGLDVWSQSTGRPGTPTYDSAGFAAFVPTDPDFGGALEIQKISATTRLRWMGEVPIMPGCYLRIRARIKAMGGVLPNVSVAAWAGTAAGVQVGGITTTGPVTSLTSYGSIVEVSAIVGTGARPGVDMVWPTNVAIAHFGIDLTGPTGGVVRVDDIIIEDVTSFYASDLIGVVDVRDYGAVGNGSTDDRPAFVAAMAAAGGRRLMVPEGTYLIGSDLTITTPVIFRGTLSMAESVVLILRENFDYPSYLAAFGNSETGFRKGLQALFHSSQHVNFDLKGRRVTLSAPVDVRALVGFDDITTRRMLSNGVLDAQESTDWNTVTVTRTATYNVSNQTRLEGISNVSGVPVGARVSGVGVGREVYVRSRSISNSRVTLSQPLFGGSGTQSYTFERYQYMLDFSGFSSFRNFEMRNVELRCRGRCSAVMLPEDGRIFRFLGCQFERPRDRAITSIGGGCQGMWIESCQFESSQQPLNAQDRTVIAFNVNSNDAKIRNNRAVLWAHFGILAGSGHLISGNHFFQGDTQNLGVRQAGLILTNKNCTTSFSGNYVDNCFLELTNEYDAQPAHSSGFSFGGLTVDGNIFFAINVASSFNFIVVRPFGPGHFLQGLHVNGNVFRTVGSRIARAERVDTTFASLASNRFRNVIFENNAYNGIDFPAESPAVIVHDQNTEATNWTVGTGGKLPFGGFARTVTSVVMEGPARDSGNSTRYDMPFAEVQQGANNNQVRLRWPQAMRGRALVTVRVDRPI